MKGFDMLAPIYDRLAGFIFGSEIYKAQLFFLDKVKEGDNILIIGGGTGKILEKISAGAHVTYIDLSPEMVKRAKERNFGCNVRFIIGSYRDVPREEFDIIITPFFLDLFTTSHVKLITKVLSQRMKVDGLWLFTDFQKTNKIMHTLLLWLMYRFFRVTCDIEAKTLPDFSSAFTSCFKVLDEKSSFGGMIISRLLKKMTFHL